jgi:toxin-antitoxin system PIN domain toxin
VVVVDLNLLLYAINRDSPQHARARPWLEQVMNGPDPVGLPWIVLLGFLRLSTSSRVFPAPLAPEEAVRILDGWLERPQVVPLAPGDRHWAVLRALLAECGTAGNLTSDAHLAALAIEHGAELHSTDRDFGRFKDLRWSNPLDAEA